jgi:hypothetical protein
MSVTFDMEAVLCNTDDDSSCFSNPTLRLPFTDYNAHCKVSLCTRTASECVLLSGDLCCDPATRLRQICKDVVLWASLVPWQPRLD